MQASLLAALDPRTNAMVHACAGSGKTWLLTARIIRILLEDPDIQPGNILAITFTRKAAAEIEARVLERARALHQAADDRELDGMLAEIGIERPDERVRSRARLLRQICLLARPALAVSTFHSWYAHLRRGFNWMTHGGSGGRVEDSSELLIAAFSRLLASDSCQQPLSRLVAAIGVDRIIEMLATAYESRLAFAALYGGAPFSEEGIRQCVRDLEGSRAEGGGYQQLVKDREFNRHLKRLNAFFSQIDRRDARNFCCAWSMEPGIERVMAIRDVLYTRQGGPRKSLADMAAKMQEFQEYSLVRAAFDRAGKVEHDRRASQFNADALAVVREHFRIYGQVKQEQAASDFADLETEIWQLLVEPDEALLLAERIDSQYRHILIDEFQDTSMPQWQIIRSWLDSAVSTDRPPGVFIVGDGKQSIFGWRGARPEIMDAAREFLCQRYRLQVFTTTTTRRCPAAVIEALNATFDRQPPAAAQEDGDGPPPALLLADFSAHETLRPDGSGAVIVLPVRRVDGPDDDSEPGERLRNSLLDPPPPNLTVRRAEIEAEGLADLIEEAIGGWLIDGEDGASRVCRPEDVMVLYRSRTHSDILARALLGRGIPCALPAAGLRIATLECSDMIALINAVCNPAASGYLMQALRSPVFGCSEDDLIMVHLAGGGRMGTRSRAWRGLARLARGRSPGLRRAWQLLCRWRRLYMQRRLPAHEVLARIYHDGEVIERYVRSVPPEIAATCVRNLEWVLNYSLERRAENVQLYGYLRQLMKMRAQRLAEPSDDAAASRPRPAGAVSMMTVHAAKGLEAPVVALAQAHFESPRESPRALVGWPAAADSPDHFSFCRGESHATDSQQLRWQQMAEAQQREQANLLYVAMTRASQALIVCAHQRIRNQGTNWHACIDEALRCLRVQPDSRGRLVHGKIRRADPAALAAAAAAPEPAAAPAAAPRRRGRLLAPQSAAARRGEKLHDLLALLLAGVEDERSLRGSLAVDGSTFKSLRADGQRMLDCPRFAQLRQEADAMELELPVLDAAGEKLLRIDCLLEFSDAVWIVDFKSPADAVAQGYRSQLEGYRDALVADGESRSISMAVLSGDGRFTEL